MRDSWRKEMVESMHRELTFYPEIEFVLRDADADNTKQITDIQKFIEEGVDLLMVSPNESNQLTPIIEKAYNSGIPVVVIDRRMLSGKYTAFVGADNVLIGKNAAVYANLLLNGRGKVIDIADSPYTTPAEDRTSGFRKELSNYPGITHVQTFWYGGDREKLTGFLSGQEADLIFSHNDRYALDIYTSLKELGLVQKVKIIGVDGLAGKDEGLDLVQSKRIAATILYPTGGEEAIRLAHKILNNEPYSKENPLYTTVINPSNVEITIAQYARIRSQQEAITRQAGRILDLNAVYDNQRQAFILTLIFLGLVLALGGVFVYLWREKQKTNKTLSLRNAEILRQKEEIERMSLQAREATEDKMRFYSYISHEFKTPLSLILTPAEDLLQKGKYDPKIVKPVLELILKNANRLLRMVNQILDLRKVDAGKLVLEEGCYDLVKFTEEIVADFRLTAQKHKIDLKFFTPLSAFPYSFDAEKLDKVLFNLLSNAFKFTPDGGWIHVALQEENGSVEISVRDNGMGMNETDQKNAFELFYKGYRNFNFGSGLGLALSREFVTLHNGEITVESTEGQGTTFKVRLPKTGGETAALQDIPRMMHNHMSDWDGPAGEVQENVRENAMIIVEDNADLSAFLAQKFSVAYSVKVVENAEKAWDLIFHEIPDIIISDVMLPAKDGFWLTQKIREDFRTSHIPVILLTARGHIDSQLEGVKAGADVYMPKPFNQQLLEENVKTLLDNRRRLRKRLESEVINPQLIQHKERKFLMDFEEILERGLHDNSLSVERLSKEMGMSRVQLYRKITALTDRNVNDYIADFKIKKAKTLLADPHKNITEIAYELGFGNPGYFTTFFKGKTGKTPSDWRNR